MAKSEKIDRLMKDLVRAIEEEASQCKTREDLNEAAKIGRWLLAVANRNLGLAIMTHAHGGAIPGPPRGSFAARAADFLEHEGLNDPTLSDNLTHVLSLQRATQFAYKHVIDSRDGS